MLFFLLVLSILFLGTGTGLAIYTVWLIVTEKILKGKFNGFTFNGFKLFKFPESKDSNESNENSK